MQSENIMKNYKELHYKALQLIIIYQFKVIIIIKLEYGKPYDIPGTPKEGPNALPSIKPEDLGYFGALLNNENDGELSLEE